MEKELMIDVTTFMNMFVAISYVEEQRIFKFDRIKKYINSVHWSDDTADFTFNDLMDELYSVFDDMIESGIIINIDDKLYRITNKIDYMTILNSNLDSLKDMREVFYNICGGNEKTIYIIPSEEYKKRSR